MKITNKKMIVEVHKEPCDKNHPYATINVEAMRKAAQNLSDDAFKLWCYLAATTSLQGKNFNDDKETAPND